MKQLHQWSEWLCIFLLSLALIPVLSAFTQPGYFTTHDGDFHIIRLAHLVQEIGQGNFPVRVVPALAEGYGYPALEFFYPLPYLIAVLFYLAGFSLGESVKAVFVLSTIVAALATYVWLRGFFAKWPALLGTILYIWVPFRVLTLYVTGQIGGVVGMTMAVLLMLSLHRWWAKKAWWGGVAVAASFAGLILAHLISIFAFLLFFIPYLLALCLIVRPSKALVTQTAVAGVLGLCLAGFYLIPATIESQHVKLGHEVLVQYTDHFPSLKQLVYSPWGYGYSKFGTEDGMSFQVGLGQWAILGVSGILLLKVFGKRTYHFFQKKRQLFIDVSDADIMALALMIGTVISIFLMLEISQPVWELLAPLQYLQYSWRLLVVPMTAVSFLAAWLGEKRWGKIIVILCIGLAVFNMRNYLRTFETPRYDDQHYLEVSYLYRGSTDISGEALPVKAPRLPQGPALSLVASPVASVSATPAHRHEFELNSEKSEEVVLNLFYFPSWKVFVNGKNVETYSSAKGLIAFQKPAGSVQIIVELQKTLAQKAGDLVSILAIGMSIIVLIRSRYFGSNKLLKVKKSRV